MTHNQTYACADLCVDRLYLGLSGPHQSVRWLGGAMAPLAPPVPTPMYLCMEITVIVVTH